MNQYKFEIEGIHCAACEIIIEREIRKLKDIKDIKYEGNFITVFSETLANDDLEQLINSTLQRHGYSIVDSRVTKSIGLKGWIDVFAITVSVISIYIIIRELLKVNISLSSANVDLVSIFIMGVLASISTCMAVVGGIVLSLSSHYAQKKSKLPIITFHFSRVVSFFLFGGVIGGIGGILVPTLQIQIVIEILLFIMFIVLGLNLLGTKVLNLGIAKNFGVKPIEFIERFTKSSSSFSTIILGAITFLVPCGFTQTAQFTAMSSGSFINGALIMLCFAVGTLPALSLISFASVKFNTPVFYKAAGLIIIAFAIINITQNWAKILMGLGL